MVEINRVWLNVDTDTNKITLFSRPRVSIRVDEYIWNLIEEHIVKPHKLMRSEKHKYLLKIAFGRFDPVRHRYYPLSPYNGQLREGVKPDSANGWYAREDFADAEERTTWFAPDKIWTNCGNKVLDVNIDAANVSENDFKGGIENNAYFHQVKEIADSEHAGVLPICAEIEAEIAGMDPEEKEMFLADMGLQESGLDRLINACYSLLGLISYLTAGQPEVRAWTIKKGTKAPQAAGKIHSDFERGFIRAEVISFDDLMACGSMAAAKEKGLVRSEGKDYVMKDGDIVLFRFNV